MRPSGRRGCATLPQPVLSVGQVLKNLHLKGRGAHHARGENIKGLVGLHDVSHLPHPQAGGLGYPHPRQPAQAIEPGALQTGVVVEQQPAGGMGGIAQVELGPGQRFGRVYVPLLGRPQPPLGFVVGYGTRAVVPQVYIGLKQHGSRKGEASDVAGRLLVVRSLAGFFCLAWRAGGLRQLDGKRTAFPLRADHGKVPRMPVHNSLTKRQS